MSTQLSVMEKKLGMIEFYQLLLEEKEINDKHPLLDSCPAPLTQALLKELNAKKPQSEAVYADLSKKLSALNMSQEILTLINLSEYEALLPLIRLAYAVEKNGDPIEHAFKLICLFGTQERALDYLKKFKKENPTITQLVHDACLFTLPKDNKWTLKIWRELGIKYMPNKQFIKVLGRASEIEQYITTIRTKMEKEWDEQITQKWHEKFEKKYEEIAAKDYSEENDYINLHIEKLQSKINSTINKQFDFHAKETLGISSKISLASKKLIAEEIQKIIDYKQSTAGKEQLKKITELTLNDFRTTLKEQYHSNKDNIKLDKKTYIEKCFEENAKLIEDEKNLAKHNILSGNTALDLLLNYNASCSYQRANEHFFAAKLFLEYGLSESDFNSYLSLKKQDSDLIPPRVNKDEIPILVDGQDIGYPGFYLTKLSPENPKCAILGLLTSCCQHLNHPQGRNCAIHAITSEQGGLYVLCEYKNNKPSHEDLIFAQSWAWRSKNGALVFDSVEIVVHLRQKYDIMISDFFTNWGHELVTRYNIPRVLVGQSGVTPKKLGSLEPLRNEAPIDYSQYRDSFYQRIIADSLLPFVQLYINSNKGNGSSLSTNIKLKHDNSSINTKIKKEEVEKNRRVLSEWCVYSKKYKLDFAIIYDYLSNFQLTKTEADAFFENTKQFFKLLDTRGDFSEIVRLSRLGVYPYSEDMTFTAVILAVHNGRADIVAELMETRAKETINVICYYSTPLLSAIERKDAASVEILLKNGADVSILTRERNPKTVLMLAAYHKSAACFSLLLKAAPKDLLKALLNYKDPEGQTILFYAVESRITEIVALLLKEGMDESFINHKDKYGRTALMDAASAEGKIDIVEMLLKANADANFQADNGTTALMLACKYNKPVMVATVLKVGIKTINFQNKYGESALLNACDCQDAATVELLLKSGANTFTTDIKKSNEETESAPRETALIVAANRGDADMVSLLLDYGAKSIINQVDRYNGKTALMYGAGNEKIVAMLLKNRAWFNNIDKTGHTAFMYAASQGNVNSIKMLLDLPGEKFLKNAYGQTALMLAAANNKTDVFLMLLALTDKNTLNDKAMGGKTLLMYATSNDNFQMVENLLKLKVDVNLKDKEGNTALIYAARNGFDTIVNALLQANADVNYQDVSKNTALFYASKYGNSAIAVSLFKAANAYSSKQLRDYEGATSLMFFASQGDKKTVLELLQAGADVAGQGVYGYTPLMGASKTGQTEMVKLLLKLGAERSIHAKNANGKTALTIAREEHHTDICDLLENAQKSLHTQKCVIDKSFNPPAVHFGYELLDTAEPFQCKLKRRARS